MASSDNPPDRAPAPPRYARSPSPASRERIRDSLAVYFKRRVLIILLLGFSGGLPIVLVGSTLQAWMKLDGIDIKVIGLAAAVALP